ncbi:hypothetical protein B9Z55_024539 [Caenorhabditis nigoni]|uniref:Uncharacterized protein n=1 Tax=Caenorhabditis nigoni TaxID=1611254 RepID=A0A2G5SUZ0_9PELO|nr:hypothetical protein B9Z55_024539 [Caenorhabditis nigoni]
MVNDVCIFHRLVETIANQKLYLYYYQMQKTAFLTEKYELIRKKKAQHLLRGTLAIFKPFLHFLMMKFLLLRLTTTVKTSVLLLLALKPASFKTLLFDPEQSSRSSGDNGDNLMLHRASNSSPLPPEAFRPNVDNLGIVYPARSSTPSPDYLLYFSECSTEVCTPNPVADDFEVNPAGSSSLSPPINSNTVNPDVDNSGTVNPPNANVEISPHMMSLTGGNSYGRPNIFQIFNNPMMFRPEPPEIMLENLRLMLTPPRLCQNIFQIFNNCMGLPPNSVDRGSFSHSPNSPFVLVNPPNVEANPIPEEPTN